MEALLKSLGLIAAAALCASCAQFPEMTRQQQLAAYTRVFPNENKEAVIDAARRVLFLADGRDTQFQDNPDGFVATRRWFVYAVLVATGGTHNWLLTTKQTDAGLQVTVTVGSIEQTMAVMPSSQPGVYTASTMPFIGQPWPGNALHELFWRRVDYMLHRTDHWATCAEVKGASTSAAVFGPLDPLCAFNADDFKPGEDISARQPRTPPNQLPAPVLAPVLAIDRAPKAQ
jgi:hypothetical protein